MTLKADRIAELLVPFLQSAKLSSVQLQLLETYLELLLRWNAKMNLTAVREPEEIVTRHFGESLFLARKLFPQGQEPESLIDTGSGAGFPGIPIKIWNDAVALTLIEANQKKATFLREVTRALNLRTASIEASRAEDFRGRAGVVTLRAVEHFEAVLPSARRLLTPGGRLALLIGSRQTQVAKTAVPDLNWQNPVQIPPSTNRVLLLGRL